MSRKSEHSDSDSNNSSSWIILDDEEKEEDNEEVIEDRQTVEDIHDFDDSDGISIISDPEDVNAETTDSAPENKTEESIDYKNTQIAKIEPKPAPISSSLTSAGFMIAGILIALYFQSGLNEDVIENAAVKYSTNDLYKSNQFKEAHKDKQYPEDYGKQNKFIETGDYNKHKQYDSKLDSKYDGRSEKEYSKYKSKDKYENKGNYIKEKYQKNYNKNQKATWDSSEEREGSSKKKLGSHEDHKNKKGKSHEEYMVKQQHLKQKDEKPRQKELKTRSRDSSESDKRGKFNKKGINSRKYNKTMSGEWYESLHKGRNHRRSEEQRGDWIFDRANMRKAKRDKAHWYFNWMDDRENVRVKKTVM